MHHTNNKEERIEKIIEAVPRRVRVDPLWDSWLRQSIHQELQKARQDWLRDKIVKLEGMKRIKIGMCNCDLEPSCGCEFRDWNDALQTIIDHYQSELDQPK